MIKADGMLIAGIAVLSTSRASPARKIMIDTPDAQHLAALIGNTLALRSAVRANDIADAGKPRAEPINVVKCERSHAHQFFLVVRGRPLSKSLRIWNMVLFAMSVGILSVQDTFSMRSVTSWPRSRQYALIRSTSLVASSTIRLLGYGLVISNSLPKP